MSLAALSHLSEGRRRYGAAHAKKSNSALSRGLDDVASTVSKMKQPREKDDLSWSKKPKKVAHNSDNLHSVARKASESVNCFANDGSFMSQYLDQAKGEIALIYSVCKMISLCVVIVHFIKKCGPSLAMICSSKA